MSTFSDMDGPNGIPDAGRELDALVAERVMGHPGRFVEWVIINDHTVHVRTWLPLTHTQERPPAGSYAGQMPPPYSTDIQCAWQVVEKIGSMTLTRSAIRDGSGRYVYGCYFELERNQRRDAGESYQATLAPYHYADSAPHAICLAALKAVGVRGRVENPR